MKITGQFMYQQRYYDLIMWYYFQSLSSSKISTPIPCPVERDDIVPFKESIPWHNYGSFCRLLKIYNYKAHIFMRISISIYWWDSYMQKYLLIEGGKVTHHCRRFVLISKYRFQLFHVYTWNRSDIFALISSSTNDDSQLKLPDS